MKQKSIYVPVLQFWWSSKADGSTEGRSKIGFWRLVLCDTVLFTKRLYFYFSLMDLIAPEKTRSVETKKEIDWKKSMDFFRIL